MIQFIRITRHHRSGITLTEIAVSFSVMAILVGLTLMAVQGARESARKLQCQNNVRQLALGGQSHAMVAGFLPSGGWGYQWMGVAERGYGPRQPGGWCFSILRFVEAESTFQIVASDEVARAQRDAVEQLALTLPPTFMCPSRKPRTELTTTIRYYGNHVLPHGRQTDYAVNGGSRLFVSVPGPVDFSDESTYRYASAENINGVCWFASKLRLKEVADGLSHTFFAGEKWVSPFQAGRGNNQPAYAGDCLDVRRFTQHPPRPDWVNVDGSVMAFGSSHQAGLYVSFCDG
jgi:hypothetical protein